MASSPFQDLSAGTSTAQSVDAYRAGNPALWGNQYAAIQSGQVKVGPVSTDYDENGNPTGRYAMLTGPEGNTWRVEEVAPNVYDLVTTNRDYVQHMVVRADPNSGYIEPIQNTSQQVNFGRWNYAGSGLSSIFQNPIAPLMLSALLPGAGSAIGSALGLGEGAISNAIGTGLLSGTTTAAAGGDFAKGALTSGLGSLVGSALSTPSVDAGSLGTASDLPEIPQVSPLADTTITDTLFADTGLLPSTTIPVSDVVTPAEQVAETPYQGYKSIFDEMYPKGVSIDPTIGMTPDEKAYYYYKDYAKGWGEPVIPTLEDWQKYGGDYNAYKLATETSMPEAAIQTTQAQPSVDVPSTSDLYSLAPPTSNNGLGLQAIQGEGTNLFQPATGIEGGGLGLQLPTVSNLDSMGGGQGLTTMASGSSGLLGENGLGTTSTTITNPLTGQPLGQELSNINTGVTDVTGAPVSSSSTSGSIPNSLVKSIVNTLLGSNMADNTNTAALGSGLLGGLGSFLQGNVSKEAAQALADRLATATGSAVSGSQFRPVGITTRFGSSNYQVNPQTGQLEAAGYTPTALSDQLQQGAQSVYNLGKGYVAQSPQEAAAQWMQAQQNLLAPSRDVALSNLRNQVFQKGREGLSMAQGGDLQAANPELAAYYNSLANQNAQLAAQAQQFGQQQAQFGTGLLGSGLNLMSGLNTLEQQPLTLGAGLGAQAATAGAQAGRLGLAGTQAGQDYLYKAMTYSPLASLFTGAGSSPLVSQATGNLLSQYIPQLGNWISGLSSVPGGGGLPDLTNYNLTSDNATNFWSY